MLEPGYLLYNGARRVTMEIHKGMKRSLSSETKIGNAATPHRWNLETKAVCKFHQDCRLLPFPAGQIRLKNGAEKMPEYMSEPWRGDCSKYRSDFCFSSVQVASMILLCSGGLGKCKKTFQSTINDCKPPKEANAEIGAVKKCKGWQKWTYRSSNMIQHACCWVNSNQDDCYNSDCTSTNLC